VAPAASGLGAATPAQFDAPIPTRPPTARLASDLRPESKDRPPSRPSTSGAFRVAQESKRAPPPPPPPTGDLVMDAPAAPSASPTITRTPSSPAADDLLGQNPQAAVSVRGVPGIPSRPSESAEMPASPSAPRPFPVRFPPGGKLRTRPVEERVRGATTENVRTVVGAHDEGDNKAEGDVLQETPPWARP
jgi:hypothetical protein